MWLCELWRRLLLLLWGDCGRGSAAVFFCDLCLGSATDFERSPGLPFGDISGVVVGAVVVVVVEVEVLGPLPLELVAALNFFGTSRPRFFAMLHIPLRTCSLDPKIAGDGLRMIGGGGGPPAQNDIDLSKVPLLLMAAVLVLCTPDVCCCCCCCCCCEEEEEEGSGGGDVTVLALVEAEVLAEVLTEAESTEGLSSRA